MSMTNDDKILALKEKIETLKKEAGAKERFNPITTCVLELFGNKINLHTINDLRDLDRVLIELNMYKQSAESLSISPEKVVISGFDIIKWMDDVRSKRNIILYNKRMAEIESCESNLNKLLSDEKKTELEIESIAQLLGL